MDAVHATARLKATQVTAETVKEYVARLEKAGMHILGRASHSVVFQHPTMEHVAVKVFAHDPGFLDYAKFCKASKNNPYCIKVFDWKHDPTGFDYERDLWGTPNYEGRTTMSVVFMEKLQPIPLEKYEEFMAFLKKVAKGKDQDRKSLLMYHVAVNTKDRNLRDIATYLVKTIRSKPYSLDLHEGNFMLRGNQVVFIDPLY